LTEFASFGTTLGSSNNNRAVPSLIDVVQAIEDSPKPVVAALAGVCLGGGCEIALACHYRVSHGSSLRLGLPEVQIGVIPGAGGTQRLPKAVGVAEATRLILTGGSLSAPQAFTRQLVDAVVDDVAHVLATAQAWASWAEVMPLTDRRLGRRSLKEDPATMHVILHTAALALPPQPGAAHGLQAALEAIRASRLPLAQGMAVEGQQFVETLTSPEGQARRHVFFAVRQAQKPYRGMPSSPHPLLDKKQTVAAAVIGAGTMGAGIALVLLQAGFAVTLVDVQDAALQRGAANIRKIVQTQVKRKKLASTKATQLLERLATTTNLADLSQCLLVVEAVVENLQIKQSIFRQLDAITPPAAFLVSNTSTLDIDAMAAAVSATRRTRFLGWHFFSPAHVMKLVEVIVGRETSAESVLVLQALTKRVGKTGVVVGNCDGFCGNRLLRPYSAEMVMLLAEGVSSITTVDRAIHDDFGMALGPFAMGDLAGNDVGYNIRKERGWVRTSAGAPRPPQQPARYTDLADVMVSQYGRMGQKAGRGWHNYDASIGKGRTPLPSPEMDALVAAYATKAEEGVRRSSSPRPLTCGEIIERVLYPLVNEGFKCLEEGIVQRPSDIDVVYVYGYGWPVWRGGPMHWADHDVGLLRLLTTLQRLHRQFPETEHYQPSRLLEDCVRQGVTVEDYWKQQEQRSKL
jgi:3-hydroxyacyl-CoA dehydrogenase/enoyl-CoA hydratase/carnithine racemase